MMNLSEALFIEQPSFGSHQPKLTDALKSMHGFMHGIMHPCTNNCNWAIT